MTTPMRDVIAHHFPASQESVRTLLELPYNDDEGRSEWRWFRTTDGDLIFGCFPRGDGYMMCEEDVHADYCATHVDDVGVLLGPSEGAPQVPYGVGVLARWDAVVDPT